MLHKLLLTCLLVISLQANASNTLSIVVKGIQPAEGTLMVAIFNSETTFLKEPVNGITKEVTDSSETIEVTLEDGEYAVAVFIDTNNNNQMDFDESGMPIEKYGFSNDAPTDYGPPTYQDAKFEVNGDGEITINLR
jgi:uncharacterized protein (DUF2141 family)